MCTNAAVQTETVAIVGSSEAQIYGARLGVNEGGQESMLTASDLASILQWSKDISSDINLSSGKEKDGSGNRPCSFQPLALQRLTEIATGASRDTPNERRADRTLQRLVDLITHAVWPFAESR